MTIIAFYGAEDPELFAIEREPTWGQMPARRWDTTTWVADPGSRSAARIRDRVGWSRTTAVSGSSTRIWSSGVLNRAPPASGWGVADRAGTYQC